ncbi:ATP-dependent Clp protease ATP-binding subunit ClpA homolog, chloroplastic-like [Neltuma alba]|uniref:ATP-dependent Clp protease ATP-binding subunit ClpA homolog, chloroplastic-like n=1 Tax=Neltuma alba TaxID=207710 RepID=UPI0010A52293|nr:ATP-dependent Clp protease ATP-binding subunit ClpA homolog, chloroplastic-like [Prosopis alba]
MLEGFTEPAKKVIIGAQQEAHLLGHKYISTEHILLALISDAGGLAAKALQSAKLNLNVMREQAEKIFGRGGGSSGFSSMELRFTHGAQLVLKLTQGEAQRVGHSLADDRDLLLGLLKGCDGGITGLLQNQGLDVNNIGDQVSRHMEGEKEKASSSNDQCAQGSNKNIQEPTLSVPIKMIAGEKEKASSPNDHCAEDCSNEISQKTTHSVPIKMIADEKENLSNPNDQYAKGCTNENSQKPIISVPIKMIAGDKEKTSSNENTRKPTLSVPTKMIVGENGKTSCLKEQCDQGCSNENSQKPTLSVLVKMIASEKEKASTNEHSQKPTLSAPIQIIAGEKENTSSSNDQCEQGCGHENSQKPTLSVPIKMITDEKKKTSRSNDQCAQGCSNENTQKLTRSVPIKMINMMPASEKKEVGSKKVVKITNYPTPILDMFGTNLTKLAQEGKLYPFVGRQEQVERVIQIFCRRTKNSPCLVGEPGVGKTAIIEGLAQKILSGSVPGKLKGKKVIKLDVAHLLYETSCQKTPEERTSCLIKEIEESGDVILFIKQVHFFFEATIIGTRKFSYILKHALQNGAIQFIGSATVDEHRRHIESDAALQKIFQPVDVAEPSVEETVKILKGLRGVYGTHHNVRYTDEALEAAAKLSQKHICGRLLPEKAIDLIDEAGSYVQHFPAKGPLLLKLKLQLLDYLFMGRTDPLLIQQQIIPLNVKGRKQDSLILAESRQVPPDDKLLFKSNISNRILTQRSRNPFEKTQPGWEDKRKLRSFFPEVTKSDIQHIVSSWTGIPVKDVSREEGECLLNLEEKLQNYVIGQNEAINIICRAIRRARLGLGDMTKPIASFLLTGPTGVGKTELAKVLAAEYFGSEDAMIRVDMSEYMDRHTAGRMVGAPPGYVGFSEGGQLTEAVKHRPYSLILFDEIDKAHSDVFNIMLQILDDGRLTDGQGHTVDFKNTLIIMTSNIGYNNRMIEAESICIKKLVMEEIKQHFRPEFLNRLDEIILFNRLTKMDVKQIAGLMLRQVSERMKGKGIDFSVTQKFSDHVVEHGYDPSYGARALRRTISRLLEDALAKKMLTREIKTGDSVVVDVSSEGNVVLKQKNAFVSRINLNRNIVAVEKRGKEGEVTCNLMSRMFDLLGHQKSP